MIPFLAIMVVIIVLIHFAARSQAQKVKALPDTYTLEVLRKEPEGEEVFITTADGTRIRAVSKGQGPTVVLAHGFMATIIEWNVISKMLVDEGYRVIAFDQRGHGKTNIGSEGVGSKQMASDYKAVLEYFNVEDGVLVGHSMGGFLSIVYALTYPEAAKKHLKGLILFGTMAGIVAKDNPQNKVQIPLIKSGIIKSVLKSDTYGTMFGTTLMGTPQPNVLKAMLPVMAAQNTSLLIPILEAMAQEDYYPRLSEIDIPTVVVCGTKDGTTPKWHSELLGSSIKGAQNIWVEGKGHLVNWEAPQELVNAVHSLSEVREREEVA
jgi:non-heme chloroperoxidase